MNEIFLEILNTGIMAGWLVLAVLIARLALKKAPAWIKCALWAIVGLRLVWPFEIKSVLSLIPSSQTIPPAELYAPAPQVHTGIPVLNSAINPVFTPTFTTEPVNSVNPLQVATTIAAWIWVLGFAALMLYALISYLRLRRLVRVSMPAGEGVYLCDHVSSPFILGIVKPRIYLPSQLAPEKWESILAHERAHLVRRDHWWKPLGFLLLTVFWFHPLLWVAYILLCRDVEMACDEKVIQRLTDAQKQDYSRVLLECSVERKWISACPLAFGETGVKQRIKAVLHYKKPTLWILIIALIVCTVLAVCFLTDPEKQSQEKPAVSYPTDTYITGELLNDVILTGYFPDVNGTLRITEDGILQFNPATLTPNGTWKDIDWQDLGALEEFTLTEVTFDNKFSDKNPFANELRNIHRNNLKAWRVPSDYGQYHYFLLQKDGTCYFVYGQTWLYHLEKQPPVSVAGKSYLYGKSEFGWEFSISFHEDGIVTYSEGLLSSHLGIGDWTQDGDLLCIKETRSFLSGPKVCTYYFQVTEEALIFLADQSDSLIYVKVADGECFYQYNPAVFQSKRLIWVDVKEITEESIVAVDTEGHYWWFDLRYAMDGNIEEGHCWISYYEPETVAIGQFSDKYPVKYVAMAAKYWRHKNTPQGVYSDMLSTVYDYCYFDVDGDGNLEICVLSDGRTSGIKSYSFTVWENGECVYEQWLPDFEHSQAVAFVFVDDGLRVVTSAGTTYDVSNADGEIHITQ